MAILKVNNLTKEFKTFRAVNDISFELKEGEILGLLGPNGAGKTTTIQMLLGILTPTSGSVEYFGKNLLTHREEILEDVNFSTTYTNLPWVLTVAECLKFTSYLYDIKNRKERVKEIIDIFDLEKLLNKKVGSLSSGQNTRVNLAKSFLNKPRVLLLDEPTASLDPESANLVRKVLLKEQKDFGISVILTSHNMNEVETVCNRVIFINEGKIVANDTPKSLAKTIKISHLELRFDERIGDVIKLLELKDLNYKKNNEYLIIDINEMKIPELLKNLIDRKLSYSEISIEKPSLEDFFLENVRREGVE
jgi:ABC-2 type transport system ATP-binding protein